MRHFRFWIFDLDGTLTRPKHDFMAIRRTLGIPLDEGILEYIDNQPDHLRNGLNDRLEVLEQQVAEEAELAPGALDLLDLLSCRGFRLGILTRNSRQCVEITLNRTGLESYFGYDDIISREDARPKPDPDGIEILLSRWCGSAESSVIVGDYLFDLRAGRNAGIQTIHYNGKQGPTWKEYSDYVIEDFSVLIRKMTQNSTALI